MAKDKSAKRIKVNDQEVEQGDKEHFVEYKVKTGEWSYKTVKEKAKKEMSKEE